MTGWFTDGSDPGAGGAYFSGVPPTRIVDTRTGLGAPSGPVAGGTSLPVHAAGHAGLPEGTAPVPATGMVATVTAVAPTAAGYLTVYPSLTAQPTASDLNFTPATYAVPNLVVDPLGVDGADLVFNYAGGTHVVVDIVGYFIGDTALPATTRTAAAGDITAVSGPPDGVRQVTLAPAAPVPAVGEVLAAGSTPATPDGLLGLVTATGTDGAGHPVLITEPAPLQQALGNGHFAIAGTLSADNVAKAGTVPKTPAGSPVSQAISKAFTCSAGGSLSVTGSVSITPTFNLSVEWGWFSLRSATFTGTLSEDASLVASAHAAAGCSAGPVPLLPTPIRFSPITFSIGPVPVVITPQLQFYLSASGTVSADLTASAVQHASGTLGVSWSNGGLHPIAQTASGFTYTPPTPSTSADVTASVGPRLQLFLYGLAGPYLSVDASIDLAVNPPATPWWTLTGGLDAGAGIAFPALDFDQGNPSILHYRKVIAHAPWPEHIYAVECLTSDCYTSMRLVQTNDAGGGKRVIGGTFSGGGLGLAPRRRDRAGAATDLPGPGVHRGHLRLVPDLVHRRQDDRVLP
ncbi:MAG: hypothetical protein AUG44_22405 [Actinobacteria bacterium 13_1_20CM_3_71_11]|nr:MAG: hypothetical protein AUG44_22405 [Actinobacteria bacterium 13_1_20CM_3_71_11]